MVAHPQCLRLGCPHARVKGESWHGYCCNACRVARPEHTRRCTGFVRENLVRRRQKVLFSKSVSVANETSTAPPTYSAAPLPTIPATVCPQHAPTDREGQPWPHPQCRRLGCPHARVTGESWQSWHGYCCNACRQAEPEHTGNCTGFVKPAFEIAKWWTYQQCSVGDLLPFLRWYADMGIMSDAWTLHWTILERCIRFVNQTRPLTIHVLPDAASANAPAEESIDAHARGLQAGRPPKTGIDRDVQAILIRQSLTAELLYDACHKIEVQELSDFTFICKYATHRSVAIAILLATLVYPNAHIEFATPRTITDAYESNYLCPVKGQRTTTTGASTRGRPPGDV